MYPNDLGMKAFAAVGAPHLETLSLVDKVSHIGHLRSLFMHDLCLASQTDTVDPRRSLL